MGNILEVHNLSVSFGKFNVLKNINFNVKEGERYGLIGISGAGKTTLLIALTGLIKPDSGVIKVDIGHGLEDIKKNTTEYRSLIGFSTQETSFYPELSVRQNLRYFASLYNLNKKIIDKNVDTALDLVDLKESSEIRASKLSGGMQKRLDIACSIIHRPLILFMDEPTADLDPIMRNHVWDLVKRINNAGTTVIIASHFLDELEHVCNRVAILHNKSIHMIGSISQLRRAYSKNHEIHIKTVYGNYDIIVEKLKRFEFLEIRRAKTVEDKLVVVTPKVEETINYLLNAIKEAQDKLVDVNIKEPSIKEIFESLINSGF